MQHAPADYIRAGYRFEAAKSQDRARAKAQRIRAMLAGENPRDLDEARALINRGRTEARTGR